MKKYIQLISIACFIVAGFYCSPSKELLSKKTDFISQDSLRGSIGPGRDWWDVLRYDITVEPDYTAKTIRGKVIMDFKWTKGTATNGYMQIDLQEPMQLDSVFYKNNKLSFSKNKNVWRINWSAAKQSDNDAITFYYSGMPRPAINPPWDGGWIFAKDEKNRPWISVACQGLGASVWYPCKDHQSDEPDQGARLTMIVEKSLAAVGNGRLIDKKAMGDKTSWTWEVKNPINNYNIVPYIGYYTNWTETYNGEKGGLDCSYWVLDYNLEKAKTHFAKDVQPMLKIFESWFGPYPFYEDSYKLVESPHLGMEHQSAIAYGNKFQTGYLGNDLSGTGWGTKWDFIIIHETGHEWFGNNITANDIADMWIQEGFTSYSEVLYVEDRYGSQPGSEYCRGLRKNIKNTSPIIGSYGTNTEGSGDMYHKGANLIHTIRQIINDDKKFKAILRGLNAIFYHQTVDSKEIEAYISKEAGKDLSKIFKQYLEEITIPILEYKIEGEKLSYRWIDCIPTFDMPVQIEKTGEWLWPTTVWKEQVLSAPSLDGFSIHPNFYIKTKKI